MGRSGELRVTLRAQLLEFLCFQKAVRPERVKHGFDDLAGDELPGLTGKISLQFDLGALAVKVKQAYGEQRRNDEDLFGIAERIAQQQARPVRHGRRKDVETCAEPR